MIFIFVEPTYSKSIWCINLLDGLTAELRSKRLLFKRIESPKELQKAEEYVFLIGSNPAWVRAMLKVCNSVGCYPILLCNQAYIDYGADYSAVCSDIEGSMRSIVKILHHKGKDRIAVYGINTKSVPDKSRLNSILAAKADTPKENLFINNGSLENCYQEFKLVQSKIDVVICVNNFTAISLVRRMKKENPSELRRLVIIGCAETRLSDHYSENIFSMRANFIKYGKAAVTIMENLKKNPYFSHIVTMIKCDVDFLYLPESTQIKKELYPSQTELMEMDDEFYEDAELHQMMRLEHLLNECDEIDRKIISRLMKNNSYDDIAEECFLTESSIKYRTKKMMNICKVYSKSELISLLKEYL